MTQDKLGNGNLLDMSQYYNLFGTTRIPQRIRDIIQFGKDLPQRANHIIITHNGHVIYFK